MSSPKSHSYLIAEPLSASQMYVSSLLRVSSHTQGSSVLHPLQTSKFNAAFRGAPSIQLYNIKSFWWCQVYSKVMESEICFLVGMNDKFGDKFPWKGKRSHYRLRWNWITINRGGTNQISELGVNSKVLIDFCRTLSNFGGFHNFGFFP